jgi:hypothetical protein
MKLSAQENHQHHLHPVLPHPSSPSAGGLACYQASEVVRPRNSKNLKQHAVNDMQSEQGIRTSQAHFGPDKNARNPNQLLFRYVQIALGVKTHMYAHDEYVPHWASRGSVTFVA